MSADYNDAVLRAGGLVDPAAKLADERVDVVGARAYRHPALGERVVVRLTPSALIAGDDIEMEVLGFGAADDRGPVGKQRRRAPGFPGWALINDPDRASFALKVMDQFKREARRARSKPGHAKTGIDAVGAELGRSVPHFLPSYYEEAGRVFVDAGAVKYAAQCFAKAREAERVHALDVDEQLRHESFVEFALVGAVTIKTIADYAKALSASYEPEVAYRRFARLCVQRTLGGMPPWGGMAKELRRMAKEAKLDAEVEERALLGEIIDSPALAKAAGEFWKAYRKTLLAMAAESAVIRGVLLNLFPSPSSDVESFDEFWLDLLDDAGALAALYDADAPAQTRPNGGTAAWLSKWLGHVRRDWRGSHAPAKTFAVIRQAAPLVVSAGESIKVGVRWGQIDTDIADLLLELGVSIELPEHNASLQLDNWARQADRPERGRDPAHLWADERFAKLLDEALHGVIGKEPFETAARGKKTFALARRKWVAQRVEQATDGGVPVLAMNLTRLAESTKLSTYVEFRDLYAPMAAIDCAVALACTLRGGIFDELGFDALDDAVESLPGAEILVTGAFPYAIAYNKVKAIVVGPKGRALEHDFRLPAKAYVQGLRYSQGQLMVIYRDAEYNWHGYWSGTPDEPFEMSGAWNMSQLGTALVLADGSMCEGNRALSAGDKTFADPRPVRGDGDNAWCVVYANNKQELRELDPRTGKLGRASRPRWLEEFITADKNLHVRASWVLPLPPGRDASPLGCRDGLIGWRVRCRELARDNHAEQRDFDFEDITGRRISQARPGWSNWPAAFVSLPGLAEPLVLREHQYYRGTSTIELCDHAATTVYGSNNDEAYHEGTPRVLPVLWWHLFEARDEAGSKALRTLATEDARALIDAAKLDLEGAPVGQAKRPELAATKRVLGERLPEITHPRLIRGVLGVVAKTAELERGHQTFAATCDPAEAGAMAGLEHVDDEQLSGVLGVIVDAIRWGEGSATRQLLEVSAFFTRDKRGNADRIEPSRSLLAWVTLVRDPRALLYLAASMGLSEEQRALVVRMLRAWAASVFAEEGHALRLLAVKRTDSSPGHHSPGNAFAHDGNDYFCVSGGYSYHAQHAYVLEHAPDGTFRALPGVDLVAEHAITSVMPKSTIEAFLAALDQHGPLAWSPAAVTSIAEQTGLTRAEATLLWAGLPNVFKYETSFLDKQLRTTLELKVTEADAARTTFRSMTPLQRARLLASAVPADAAALWTGALADAMSAGWVAQFGKRPPIPDELIVEAGRQFSTHIKPATALVAFAQPELADMFTRDLAWTFKGDGELVREGEEPGFDVHALAMAALYVPFVFTELPVGHPVRARLPDAIELVAERVRNPELLLTLTHRYFSGDNLEAERDAFVEAIGGEPFEAGTAAGRDAGHVVTTSQQRRVIVFVRPVRMGDDDWEGVNKLATGPDVWNSGLLAPAHLLMSDGYAAMAARVRDTPVPEGGWEANPALSVPELVEAVGAELDLSRDAAVLYLQTLAILSPSRKQVLAWNGWKPGQYKKAAAELARRELVIEAKRARAGRDYFLPGGWEALKSPLPTLETWKMPLYQLRRADTGHVESPLAQLLPLRPLHELFEQAWQRVVSGDSPRYEEVS